MITVDNAFILFILEGAICFARSRTMWTSILTLYYSHKTPIHRRLITHYFSTLLSHWRCAYMHMRASRHLRCSTSHRRFLSPSASTSRSKTTASMLWHARATSAPTSVNNGCSWFVNVALAHALTEQRKVHDESRTRRMSATYWDFQGVVRVMDRARTTRILIHVNGRVVEGFAIP